jgi:PTS system ascorbate-specific IIA component
VAAQAERQEPAEAAPNSSRVGLVPSLLDLLPVEAIRLHVRARDWREAVTVCGDALVAAGIATQEYTAQMIATVERLGPYIVVAPGMTLAHARPSRAVLRPGLSWVTLADPVCFGHPDNDPVVLVVGLAAPDKSTHVRAPGDLAAILEHPERRGRLLAAGSPQELREEIARFERQV